jgi:hypothetical protein
MSSGAVIEYLSLLPGRKPPQKGIDIRDAVKLMRG